MLENPTQKKFYQKNIVRDNRMFRSRQTMQRPEVNLILVVVYPL